jgi:hypothetical protein
MKAMTDKERLELYDNTRISAFKSCPRLHFFRHVLDLETEQTRAALVFGGAWHKAMDTLWPDMVALGRTPNWKSNWQDAREEIVVNAFAAFQDEWTARGLPGLDEMESDQYLILRPRTPTTALEMLYTYADERRTFLTSPDLELLGVEVPFAVPLDPQRDSLFYVGRFDKKISLRGKVHGIEHKTTTGYKKNGPFKTTFVESFSPNSQIDGYLFAGHSEHGSRFKSIMVDAALVHNTETGFRWINVERQTSQLDAWLWETSYWINQIQANRAALREEEKSNDRPPYLAAFPKNTGACIAYESTCTYLDLCKMWSNPLGHDTPLGFQVNKWEPFEELDLHKVFGRRK